MFHKRSSVINFIYSGQLQFYHINVIMLSVIMLSVIMLSVRMLNVVTPKSEVGEKMVKTHYWCTFKMQVANGNHFRLTSSTENCFFKSPLKV